MQLILTCKSCWATISHLLGLLGLPADHVGNEFALPLGHSLALLLAAHRAHRLSDRGAVGDSSASLICLQRRAYQKILVLGYQTMG